MCISAGFPQFNDATESKKGDWGDIIKETTHRITYMVRWVMDSDVGVTEELGGDVRTRCHETVGAARG